jgi:hypothetical protein
VHQQTVPANPAHCDASVPPEDEKRDLTAVQVMRQFNRLSESLGQDPSVRSWYKDASDFKQMIHKAINEHDCTIEQPVHLATNSRNLREEALDRWKKKNVWDARITSVFILAVPSSPQKSHTQDASPSPPGTPTPAKAQEPAEATLPAAGEHAAAVPDPFFLTRRLGSNNKPTTFPRLPKPPPRAKAAGTGHIPIGSEDEEGAIDDVSGKAEDTAGKEAQGAKNTSGEELERRKDPELATTEWVEGNVANKGQHGVDTTKGQTNDGVQKTGDEGTKDQVERNAAGVAEDGGDVADKTKDTVQRTGDGPQQENEPKNEPKKDVSPQLQSDEGSEHDELDGDEEEEERK